MKAIQIKQTGGPEVMELVELPVPEPKSDEVVVKIAAAGVNFIDVYNREGRYKAVLPLVLGQEAAGTVFAIGSDVKADFEEETKRLTSGKGVDVVYDSVGKTTFDKGLNSLRPRGMMVLYGASSGAVVPMDPQVLNQKGSLYLTRPTLVNYTATTQELRDRAGAVFAMIRDGKLKLKAEHVYALKDVQQAHRDLEARKTTGKLLLIP